MRLDHATNGEGKRHWDDVNSDDERDELPPEKLSQAAIDWVRQGYRVRYSDAYLIQLIRRGRQGRESAPFLALALLGVVGAAAAVAIAVSRRPWHVVTLAIGPHERVVTHQQRSMHPPEP